MTYRGTVKGGVVVLEEAAEPLPEGTTVRVEAVPADDEALRSLRQGLLRIAGTVTGLPADTARNHDHHLHGGPRT